MSKDAGFPLLRMRPAMRRFLEEVQEGEAKKGRKASLALVALQLTEWGAEVYRAKGVLPYAIKGARPPK